MAAPTKDAYTSTQDGIPDPLDGQLNPPSLYRQCLKIAIDTNTQTYRPGGQKDARRLVERRLRELESGNYPERALKGIGPDTDSTASLSDQIAMLKRIVVAFHNLKTQNPWDELAEFDFPGTQLTDGQYNEVASILSTEDDPSQTDLNSLVEDDGDNDSPDPKYNDNDFAMINEMRQTAGYVPLDPNGSPIQR